MQLSALYFSLQCFLEIVFYDNSNCRRMRKPEVSEKYERQGELRGKYVPENAFHLIDGFFTYLTRKPPCSV